MGRSTEKIEIFLEIGKKKVFAGSVDWPGWCRFGRDEEPAIQKLLDYGPRYAHIIVSSELGFIPPEDLSSFNERLAPTEAAIGFHGNVNRPTPFLVGERGPERVDVTPLTTARDMEAGGRRVSSVADHRTAHRNGRRTVLSAFHHRTAAAGMVQGQV